MSKLRTILMMDLLGLHKRMESELNDVFTNVIHDSDLINGNEVLAFSQSLASFLKTSHLIPCANGTDAIQLALMALDLPKGSEIIVPSHNYISAPEMIVMCGHKPVFCDVDLETYNTIASLIEERITDETKAVIVTHLYGQSCDMGPIMELAKRYDLKVIEDNAQSIGAQCEIDGEQKFAGTVGHIGTTSFYPTKVLGCLGDGGAVFTDSEIYANRVKSLANHGQVAKFEYTEIGINSRLDTLQAAILNVKLKYIQDCIDRRRQVAKWYDEGLNSVSGIEIPVITRNSTHVYHHYTVKISEGNNRTNVQEKLKKAGIESAIIYPTPIHQTRAFDFQKCTLSNTEKLSHEILSLPMHTELTAEDVSYIVETLKKSL